MTLHELGLKHGTDKATYHDFCKIYDKNMNHLRNEKIRFLEIGIASGFSIKMWEEYFTEAEIIGVDILDKKYLESNRIKTMVVNQEIENQLLNIPGDFDVIVEDGGHTMLQQQITLKVMMKKLKSKGIYVLEDLHTSLPNFAPFGYGCTELNNTKRLLEDLIGRKMTGDYFINEDEFSSLLEIIESIEIFTTSTGSITSCIRKV